MLTKEDATTIAESLWRNSRREEAERIAQMFLSNVMSFERFVREVKDLDADAG